MPSEGSLLKLEPHLPGAKELTQHAFLFILSKRTYTKLRVHAHSYLSHYIYNVYINTYALINWCPLSSPLIHWSRVMCACINERGHHWFMQWLLAYSASNHYLNQPWHIVKWAIRNKFQWDFNRNTAISVQENEFENIVCKLPGILSVTFVWHLWFDRDNGSLLCQMQELRAWLSNWIPQYSAWYFYLSIH